MLARQGSDNQASEVAEGLELLLSFLRHPTIKARASLGAWDRYEKVFSEPLSTWTEERLNKLIDELVMGNRQTWARLLTLHVESPYFEALKKSSPFSGQFFLPIRNYPPGCGASVIDMRELERFLLRITRTQAPTEDSVIIVSLSSGDVEVVPSSHVA
jgi:hypothetical protein